jgi:hypothetical protein
MNNNPHLDSYKYSQALRISSRTLATVPLPLNDSRTSAATSIVMSTTLHGVGKSSWNTGVEMSSFAEDAETLDDMTQPLNGSPTRPLRSKILYTPEVNGVSIVAFVIALIMCGALFAFCYGLWMTIYAILYGQNVPRISVDFKALEDLCRAIRDELPGRVMEFSGACGDIWADENRNLTGPLVG